LQYVTANLVLVSPATDITSLAFPAGAFYGLTFSNFRVQSRDIDLSSVVPKNGLQMWLAADRVAGSQGVPAETVAQWTDLSGKGNHATQTNPALQPSVLHISGATGSLGPTCQPLVNFGGGSYLNFRLPITGLQEMTIFLVAGADADGDGGPSKSQSAAIFWNEAAFWGTTFLNPYQSDVTARFGTTQVNNNLVYQRPFNSGGDLTVTTFQKAGDTDSLWVDGQLALRQSGKLSRLNGTRDDGFLGLGYLNTPWTGSIGEVLVYNRAMTTDERTGVEHYLMSKHLDLHN
jgi:hypothetical protein